jgi:hypothetical protein
MKSSALILLLALLAGCAAAPQTPGTIAPEDKLAQVQPGHTSKAELAARLGQTRKVVFDSGYEAWLYDIPVGAGQYAEFVVLIDPLGVVSKTRRRAPAPP